MADPALQLSKEEGGGGGGGGIGPFRTLEMLLFGFGPWGREGARRLAPLPSPRSSATAYFTSKLIT